MRWRIGRKAIFAPIALPHAEEAVSRSDSGNPPTGGQKKERG
jgi:hypothetical protein